MSSTTNGLSRRVYITTAPALPLKELLSDGPYKEKYRADMIVWGERKRNEDPGYFARLVVDKCTAPVLIISDARRPTDLAFFQDGAAR